MGKASMCIQMLQILNSGRVYKVSELANLLETNPRNVIEYKKELEEVGYYIDTIPGRYGGYQINKTVTLPSLKFLPNETRSLDLALDYLLKRSDFLDKETLQKAMAKVYSSMQRSYFDSDLLIIDRFPYKMPREELKRRFEIISDAIRYRKKLKMKYVSQKNVETEYIYHPYDFFMYNNSWFVIGWNELYSDVIYLKLNRISEIEMTKDSFTVLRDFDISNYVNENGFVSNDGDYHHLKFIALNQNAAIVKERIYGKNQVVTPIDDTHTMVECDMKTKGKIIDFMLGFQKNIEIIEPEWVKEELANFGEYLVNQYKK